MRPIAIVSGTLAAGMGIAGLVFLTMALLLDWSFIGTARLLCDVAAGLAAISFICRPTRMALVAFLTGLLSVWVVYHVHA